MLQDWDHLFVPLVVREAWAPLIAAARIAADRPVSEGSSLRRRGGMIDDIGPTEFARVRRRRWMSRVLQLDDVDLGELASWIDSRDYGSAYLDPATGEVYPAFEGEVLGPDGEPIDLDDVDWRPIGGSSSRAAYQDMEDFADAVGAPAIARQLWSALGGKGAFRRFRDQVYRQPEEISRAWQRYRDLRATIRAVKWLHDEQLVVEADATARVEQLAEVARQTLDQVRDVAGSHPGGTEDRAAPSGDRGRPPRLTVIDGD